MDSSLVNKAQCPACADKGEDRNRDNLMVIHTVSSVTTTPREMVQKYPLFCLNKMMMTGYTNT